jgi:integrase/recombinase XerD
MPKGLYQRNGIYWARFKVKGIEYRESLRTRSLATAERRLKAARDSVNDRVFFGASEAISWPAAVVSWSEKGYRAIGIKISTFDRYLTSIGQLRGHLDDKDIQRIDVKLLKTIVSDRQRHGATNATIRRDMTAISSVLAHAVDMEWIEENPAKMIDRSRFKERKAKIILPRDESLERVFALPGRFMDMAELALETGMREEEIASLEHDRIDRARMTVTLEENKGDRIREVPLTVKALAIIDRQPRHFKARWVFWRGNGQRYVEVHSEFFAKVGRVARKATQQGIDFRRFRFHDLRHLFAVRYLRDGLGTIYDLQQVLGHSSIKTTERYLDHLTPDERQAAIRGVAHSGAQTQRFPDEKA